LGHQTEAANTTPGGASSVTAANNRHAPCQNGEVRFARRERFPARIGPANQRVRIGVTSFSG
jgi:hypothetical protein